MSDFFTDLDELEAQEDFFSDLDSIVSAVPCRIGDRFRLRHYRNAKRVWRVLRLEPYWVKPSLVCVLDDAVPSKDGYYLEVLCISTDALELYREAGDLIMM